jgi:hypothetical protein
VQPYITSRESTKLKVASSSRRSANRVRALRFGFAIGTSERAFRMDVTHHSRRDKFPMVGVLSLRHFLCLLSHIRCLLYPTMGLQGRLSLMSRVTLSINDYRFIGRMSVELRRNPM